jgi:hypothetical protein
MKCVSCEAEIDPKWKNAISQNLCPFCGNPILEETLKEGLAVLAEVMKALEGYEEHVNDWLFANYGYIKSNQKYKPKPIRSNNSKEDEVIDVQDQEVTDAFMQRAGSSKLIAEQSRLRDMANRIKKGETTMILSENGDSSTVSFDPSILESNVDSDDISNLDDDDIPASVLNFAKGGNSSDIVKLQNSLSKKAESQNSFRSGKGSFSRSSS